MRRQVIAGIVAGFVYTSTMHDSFALGPGKGHGLAGVGVAEIVFTFVVCFAVLCVATTKESEALTGSSSPLIPWDVVYHKWPWPFPWQ